MRPVRTGLENIVAAPPTWLRGQRLGLLCHPASVDAHLVHGRDRIRQHFPGQLKALFSPQHGYLGEKQDNMIESDHMTDPVTGLPVYSLYGESRHPSREMLADLDALLVDLQDVGTRVYTFIYTLSYCMEMATKTGTRIVVLDRPNPIGGMHIEGNCLENEMTSFVGRYPLPMRHGLTIAELARLFNDHFGIGCSLEVIPMSGWQRHMHFEQTGLPWVAPSPNLPTVYGCRVYPGQVLWEGTEVSEARGTTQPFELFGAPFIQPQQLLNALAPGDLEGVFLRSAHFEPTYHKWQGQLCNGFQLHVTDPNRYRPYRTSLALMQAVARCWPDDFAFKQPPYEYEYVKQPIDLLIGSADLRKRIFEGEPLHEAEAGWQPDLERFRTLAARFHIY